MLRTFTSELPNHLRGPLVHSKRILSLAGGRQFCDILRVCFHDQVGSANWLCVPDLELFGSTREIVAHYFFAVHSRNLFHGLFKDPNQQMFFLHFSLLLRMMKRWWNTPIRPGWDHKRPARHSGWALGQWGTTSDTLWIPLVNVYIAMENHIF